MAWHAREGQVQEFISTVLMPKIQGSRHACARFYLPSIFPLGRKRLMFCSMPFTHTKKLIITCTFASNKNHDKNSPCSKLISSLSGCLQSVLKALYQNSDRVTETDCDESNSYFSQVNFNWGPHCMPWHVKFWGQSPDHTEYMSRFAKQT